MIKIENLKKNFGDTVACDIESLQIADGEIVGLVGNNGAGKTTLFRMILDLLKPDDGSLTLDDINPAGSEAWKDFTGAYIDDGFLIDFLTPEEYFQFIARISGIGDIDSRVSVYDRLLGDEVLGKKKLIRNLSAGNKQKVGIVAALVTEPRIVILDEPFNFLDPSSQLILKHVLTDYAHETGATLIISSHNLQHTVDISNRIALLEHGVIIRDLPNQEASAAAELEEYFGGKE